MSCNSSESVRAVRRLSILSWKTRSSKPIAAFPDPEVARPRAGSRVISPSTARWSCRSRSSESPIRRANRSQPTASPNGRHKASMPASAIFLKGKSSTGTTGAVAGWCQITRAGTALGLQGDLPLRDPLEDLLRLGQFVFLERQVQVLLAELLDLGQKLLQLIGIGAAHVLLGDFKGPQLAAHPLEFGESPGNRRDFVVEAVDALAALGPQGEGHFLLGRHFNFSFKSPRLFS